MFRLLSLILVMVGLAAAAYGAMQVLAPRAALAPVAERPDTATSQTVPKVEAGPKDMAPAQKPTMKQLEDDTFKAASSEPDIMSKLRSVPIAHETPSTARFGLPFEVTVAINAAGGDSAVGALPGSGNIVEGVAQVSGKVKATLSGGMFAIEAISPSIQTLSPLTENVWRWRATPNAVGAHELVIELFAFDGEDAMPVRTFRDKVEVEVSRVGQVMAIVDSVSPLSMLLGGIGSFLAGLFGAVRLFRR